MRLALALALALALLVVGPALASQAERPGAPPGIPVDYAGPLVILPGFQADGVAVLPEGVPGEFFVSLMNPTDAASEGEVVLEASGAVELNLTRIAYSLPPGGHGRWSVLATASGDGGLLRASASSFEGVEREVRVASTVPLAVVVDSPPQGANVGLKERVGFRANVTNHGAEPIGGALALQLGEGEAGRIALDPPLAPGETRAVDFGEHAMPKPPGRGPSEHHAFGVSWRVTYADAAGGEAAAVAFGTEGDRLAWLRTVRGDLHVTSGPTMRFVAERVALGEPSTVVAIIRNDGEEAFDAVLTIGASSTVSRLRPEWGFPALRTSVRVEPGETLEVPHEFVPRVAGRIGLYAMLSGERFGHHQSLDVELSSPVTMSAPDGGWILGSSVGESANWTLSATSAEDLPGARLRVAVAPRYGGGYDGLVSQSDILRVDVQPLDGGDGFAAGETRRFRLDLSMLASGYFLVVPYVEHEGIAYLAPLSDDNRASLEQESRAGRYQANEVASLGAVAALATVLPRDAPPLLALAPGLLVVAGTAGLWVGRRFLVR